MSKMLTVAACICQRYQETYGEKIDEMKLHKMLYFAQRESLIQNDAPLFRDVFHGWKYGPVMKKLRKPYQEGTLPKVSQKDVLALQSVLDKVFAEYAEKDSFSLCRLTHGEISWRISRKGVSPAENSDNSIKTEDIRLDALRVRQRREMLNRQDTP